MRLFTTAIAGAGLGLATLFPGMVSADAKVYPYHASANYCPAGLQPITISGVICCGVPNQHITYQKALAHPVAKRHAVVRRSARPDCQPGTKGCTDF